MRERWTRVSIRTYTLTSLPSSCPSRVLPPSPLSLTTTTAQSSLPSSPGAVCKCKCNATQRQRQREKSSSFDTAPCRRHPRQLFILRLPPSRVCVPVASVPESRQPARTTPVRCLPACLFFPSFLFPVVCKYSYHRLPGSVSVDRIGDSRHGFSLRALSVLPGSIAGKPCSRAVAACAMPAVPIASEAAATPLQDTGALG